MAYSRNTWVCGDVISAQKLNNMEDGIEEALECCGGDVGYECEVAYTPLLNKNITTAFDSEYGYAFKDISTDMSHSGEWTFNTLRVTFDGTEYICNATITTHSDGVGYQYGASFDIDTQQFDWSEYPFAIDVFYGTDQSAWGSLDTQNGGTYAVKIEYATETVETSECFDKAVRASLSTSLLKNIADAPNGGIVEGNIQDSIPQEGRNVATGLNAHAEGGIYTPSVGDEGDSLPTTATGRASHAEGAGTTASNQTSHAEGYCTTASGDYSHAEGNGTQASGVSSHAEGSYTEASGDISHAEGSSTKAIGNISHAEGTDSKAMNEASHAEGAGTTASGYASHAEGWNTIANHKSQHVFGEHNISDPSAATANARGTYVEIVGNGVGGSGSGSRSNARTLDWNGNEWLAGSLTLGNTTLTEAQLQALLALLQ